VSNEPAILLRDVSLTYPGGSVPALDGVSLRVEAGEAVGIAGQNGSGKTTLAKLLNGLLRPTHGSVVVRGQDTARRSVQQMASVVGFVFQNPNHQLFASSVAAELAYGPRALGVEPTEVARRIAEGLAAFGLTAHAQTHPHRLSPSLRKLVAIAAVEAMRPAIIVFDEPTTGQDHQTAAVISRLIGRLRDGGSTVICVAHDMPLLAGLATRLVVMHEGRILADGRPREVFTDASVMARSRLRPPQVSRISLGVVGRAGQEGRLAALSVAELASELRATRRAPGVATEQG
jgi:energy-coupling factor transport system ATP-binding protein